MEKPVHIHVERATNTNGIKPTNDIVKRRFEEWRQQSPEHGFCYMDMEVMFVFPLYEKVLRNLGRMKILEKESRKLQTEIDQIARSCALDRNTVWRRLIQIGDRKLGKDSANEPDQTARRLKDMEEFFTQTFYRENFCCTDVMSIALAGYLKFRN